MFLSVENISTLQSTKYISEEDFKRDYKVYPQENDILMTRIGDVGTTNVVTDNTLKAYYVSLALLKYKNTNPYFLSNAMQSNYVQKGLANRTLKTAVPMKINKDEIGKVDVILTAAVEEQSKIGSYFKNLDNLITLHQREKRKDFRKKINIIVGYMNLVIIYKDYGKEENMATRGKSINLFLMDGEASGRIKCTLANWTGLAYKIPRID